MSKEIKETENLSQEFHISFEEATILADVLNRVCKGEGIAESKGLRLYRDDEDFIALDVQTAFDNERQLVYLKGRINYDFSKFQEDLEKQAHLKTDKT